MPLTADRNAVLTDKTPLAGTFGKLLVRGLIAGLIAGLFAGLVAYLLGEPHINAAIDIEEAMAAVENTDGHSHGEDELVSRTGQQFGLFLATGLIGMALGAVLATVLHYARRFSTLSGTTLVLATAALGWLAIEAVPFVKYSANPPAVGAEDTVNERTLLWLAAVVVGLLAVAAAIATARWLSPRVRGVALLAAPTAAFLVVAGIGVAVLPTINEVGPDFPASLLWEFRMASVATQAALWLVLGFAFAFLTERASSQERAPFKS